MARKRRIGWYSISLDTLRGWGMFLVLAALVGAAFFGYRYWESRALERRATELIAEGQELVQRLQGDSQVAQFAADFASGRDLVRQAEGAYASGDVRTAVEVGKQGRNMLAAILSYVERKGAGGEAHFLSVQGDVEFRPRDSSDWETARRGMNLESGDHVRTSGSGSAQIMFSDGTFYTVNPNSAIVVTRRSESSGTGQAVKIAYGLLNLFTQDNPTRIETPEAEAEVSPKTEAFVAYEEESKRSRFGAVRGEMKVSTAEGLERRLGDLEQVTQEGGLLSEARRMPSPPNLVTPADNREIDASRSDEVVLQWDPVPGATGYELQVGRNRLFVDNVVEDTGRRKDSARLGIRGEGTFLWRVAAERGDEGRGPWSATRTFRVTSYSKSGEGDTTPPDLTIDDVDRYGSIFIVEGRTEAGASVEVNGEAVTVNADGAFTKTIQLVGEGWSFIEVKARDAWGNEADRRRRVFIESQ
jgi:hypothetical protein